MKKLDDAVKRFGAPDHGRTAKRLRDFEAQLTASNGILKNGRVNPPYGGIEPCCEFMLLNGSCHVHGQRGFDSQVGVPRIMLPGSATKAERDAIQREWPRNELASENLQATVLHQRGTIAALQELLNQRDEEIGKLQRERHARARDLWITGGLVALVLLAAYYGIM